MSACVTANAAAFTITREAEHQFRAPSDVAVPYVDYISIAKRAIAKRALLAPDPLPFPRQFVSLVIPNDEGKYLSIFLKKKKTNPWRFAGGKIEKDELPIVAAAREMYEEIGVEPVSLSLVHTTKILNVDGDRWRGSLYLARPKGKPRIMEPDKVGDMRYLSADDLLALGSVPEYEAIKEIEKWALQKHLWS